MRVFDLHCDTVDALAFRDLEEFHRPHTEPHEDLGRNAELALSLDRMQAAAPQGWAQCFAVFVPDALPGGHTPYSFYQAARAYFQEQLAKHPEQFAQVRDARQIAEIEAQGKVAALFTIENGSPAEGRLERVEEWARDGVKMVTLTWNGATCIGSGHVTQDGLTAFGREVVRAMEELHIVVDISHLNDVGFWEVARMARRPFAASHSNARAVCGHKRNLTDDMFRALRDAGGIVGLNYYVDFVAEHAWDAELGEPAKDISADELFAHVDHWLDLDGADAIALGSDFDGCDCPSWLAHAQDLPALYQLAEARYGADLAEKLFHSNAETFFVRNETA